MHPLIKAVIQQTDQQFWQATGYRPGRRLNYRDRSDAAMIPVWLTTEHAVLVALLTNLREQPDVDPASIQVLADYKHELDRRFTDDPTIIPRSRAVTERLAARRPQANS